MMIRRIDFGCILVIMVLLVLGCSQSSPMDPQTQSVLDRPSNVEDHALWGYYQFYIDPTIPSIEIVPLRQVEKHFNVKPFVNPPNCDDCVLVQPTGPLQNHILPVDVTLKNPKQIKGYDIRGILLSDDPGAYLDNPDNYTGLFDNGGDVNINPFKAYAKTVDNRGFGPGESFMEHYDIYLSKFNKVTVIDYAIDASWPGRAKEPYEIGNLSLVGELDSLGANTVLLFTAVLAAGNDVVEVMLDCSSLGFTEDLELNNPSGTTWELSFKNTPLASPGDYRCLLKASTASSNKYLYHYFYLTVVEGSPASLANDVQPIFNAHCTDCHKAPAPPASLDLSEGNAHSNTVGVASVQSAILRITAGDHIYSYLYAKLMGMHLYKMYEGAGVRMPQDGPPYLSDEEIDTIVTWINLGALDN